jgi:hypothetical protein
VVGIDPGRDELLNTASEIAGGLEDPVWLESLSTAFHAVYTQQAERVDQRDWIGMRDFYSLIKALRRHGDEVARSKTGGGSSGAISWPQFVMHLCRNFGGKPDVLTTVLEVFHRTCSAATAASGGGGGRTGSNSRGRSRVNAPVELTRELPSSLQLIRANLADKHARHLMVLTDHGAALTLLFQCNILKHLDTVVRCLC